MVHQQRIHIATKSKYRLRKAQSTLPSAQLCGRFTTAIQVKGALEGAWYWEEIVG